MFILILSIGAALVLCLLSIVLVDAFSKPVDLSVSGVNYFFGEVLKIPLLTLAALIPVLGLIKASSKMIQSERQLFETQIQNTASNYYLHKQQFAVLCDRVTKNEFLDIEVDSDALYRWLFPQNTPYNMVFDRDMENVSPLGGLVSFLKGQEMTYGSFENWVKHIGDSGDKQHVIHLHKSFRDTCRAYGINAKGNSNHSVSIQIDQDSWHVFPIIADGTGMSIMALRKVLDKLCSFANARLDYPASNDFFWLDGKLSELDFYEVKAIE
ncbi:hypothetical protein GGC03_20670 (plasmid) [Vibrio sp. THAF191c]|nr:hypothetical protein FIU99_19770 [Vibrio sp. THAF64]QGM36856.1 hypothetical protein GGC04_21460 [Vibrio sp. THAF191d]QGN72197.1 hypothetical protein GGC03_20670 [Vibrio sp. THAF191c]